MLTDDWENLSAEILTQAIENDLREGKEVEFKTQQDLSNTGHKQSTVGEVCSFGNSRGGDLVIGMKENDGVAEKLWPVDYEDPDETVLRWNSVIENNTDPQFPQALLDIKVVEITERESEYVDEHATDQAGFVLVIRVQRSWRSPHRETYKHHFYERGAAGKSPLDSGGIRRAMLETQLIGERAQEFRDDRLSAIQARDVTVPIFDEPRIVIHLIPANSFAPEANIDISAARFSSGRISETNHPLPLGGSPRPPTFKRYTTDGFLAGNYLPQHDDLFLNYVLTFRQGIIETVTFQGFERSDHEDLPNYIQADDVRNMLETHLPRYRDFVVEQGMSYPIFIYMSFVELKGWSIGMRGAMDTGEPAQGIDRTMLRLPEVTVNTEEETLDDHINRMMDTLYQAGGDHGEHRVE